MLNFIRKHEDNTLEINYDHSKEILDTTFQKYINKILMQHLTDLKSREHITKKALSLKAKVPIYLDDRHLLMCIYSYRQEKSLYINYHAIQSYEKKSDGIYLIFRHHHMMKIPEIFSFFRQMKRCLEIIEYLKNEKVFTYL